MAGRVISAIPGEEWAQLFTGFTGSAFRLETFQHYSAPDEVEALARFRAGEDPHIDLAWWTDLARKHTQAGRTMSRVRVITEPPSEYTRFELIAYPVMAAAGDDIKVISVRPGDWPANVPRYDYWLFDDRDVWVLNYDSGGVLRSAELRDDPQAVQDHRRWRDAALAQAIPVNEYLAAGARRAP
jgi:hypothetical protein